MADSTPIATQAATPKDPQYALGYQDGLYAGFQQGLYAQQGPQEPSRARIVAAWFTLFAGLGGAAGVILTANRKSADLGSSVIVSSAILTAVVGSLQVLSAGGGADRL
jgi:hypothetical protein